MAKYARRRTQRRYRRRSVRRGSRRGATGGAIFVGGKKRRVVVHGSTKRGIGGGMHGGIGQFGL